MRAALEHFVERAGDRRRVAVLGDMLELGAGAPEYHREIGGRRAGARDRARDRGRRAGRATTAATWVATAAEAAERLARAACPGDAVLVKGSRGVGLEVVAENLTP